LKRSKLHTVLEVGLHQCSAERDHHLPSYAVLDALQDTVGPFGCQGTLLTCTQLAINSTAPKSQGVHFQIPIGARILPSSYYCNENTWKWTGGLRIQGRKMSCQCWRQPRWVARDSNNLTACKALLGDMETEEHRGQCY